MKIALFGGSFNPIHIGHIELASAVLKELHYQKIIFMPAFVSPFKTKDHTPDNELAFPIDRLNMVRLATQGEPRFECSSYEIEKDEPSFTINTIEYLYSVYGKDELEGKLGLIIGSDQLLQFKEWKNYEKILDLCELIVAIRKDEEKNENKQEELKLNIDKLDFKFTLLKTPVTTISSTTIRNSIATNDCWEKWARGTVLHSSVAYYIEKNAMYGSPFRYIEGLIEDVIEYAKSELSERRFLHSKRVASMAKRLANVYPHVLVSSQLAYLAGIAHDITKEKSDSWQKKTIHASGESIDDVEKAHPRLLHGRTAAIILKQFFYIEHRSLLDAIRNHTFAHPLLDHLGKILYIADKVEEGRQGVDEVRAMIGSASIDEIMIVLLERGEALLKAKETLPHPYTIELLKKLKKIR